MRSPHHRLVSPFSLAAVVASLLAPAGSGAQSRPVARDSGASALPSTFVMLGSPADDDLRLLQLFGAPTDGYLLRSPSTLTRWPAADGDRTRVLLVLPRVGATYNSDLPYSLNDGALWAGRGLNLQLTAGAGIELGRVRLMVAPSFTYSGNQRYALADPTISPPVPASRNPFSSPWHAGAQSIDLPIRFGASPFARLGAGQSSLVVAAGPVELGAATENEWWGPGIRNSLLLSDNAEGFPHLFVRSARPFRTAIGRVEGRWISGGLTESAYFDRDPGNDLRFVSLLGVTLEPRGTKGLTLGAARSVFGAADGWATALASFPRVLGRVGNPDAVPLADSVTRPGKDGLVSLFGRLVLPAARVEVYAEWGRSETPRSVRDLLEQPNNSQAYTLGLQWAGPELAGTGGRLRVQAEATYLEQSTTYRFRPVGSWYTSHAVAQGYTERGQSLGAAIGPGSSSQFLAVDHLAADWQIGAYLTRVRWLDDAESQKSYPLAGIGYCSHDVSTLPGVRGRLTTPAGTFSLDYSSGWRLNVFFDKDSYCDAVGRDQRNKSLTIGFTPR